MSAPAPPIYLDHFATTPVDPRVLEAMLPWFSRDFGNAASRTHVFGWRAEAAVEQARAEVARALGAREPREIVFTSGATESNNLALQGVARALAARGDHLVTVATEHRAVLDVCRALEREGRRVTVLPVDGGGRVDPDELRRAIEPSTVLVSVMAANNEIGVLQPLAELAAVCRERGVLLHSDAAQAAGKIALDVAALGLDLLSVSGHKVYGPKGVGALYVRSGPPRVRIAPLLHGGGHERGLRSGTLPVPLLVGLGRALALAVAERDAEGARLAGLRDRLWQRLQQGLGEGVVRNGDAVHCLPAALHVSFPGVDAAALLAALPDVALSTGSACSSASPEPSHVLRALGLPVERVRSGIRFALGRFNTAEEIERAAARVVEEVEKLDAARRSRQSPPRAAPSQGRSTGPNGPGAGAEELP
jgi:cysteine desulfurase